MKSIGDEAFYYCNYLTSVTLSEGLESIGDSAFNWCDSLASVTIPASVKNLGNCVFYSCDDLASVTLSEGLESIGGNAFGDCYNLSSLTIPKSVTYIGGGFPGSLTPTVYFDTYAWRYCISNNISCNVLEGDGKTYVAAGECGAESASVYWKLDSDGLLTISGSGDMDNFDSYYGGPWHDWNNDIKTVEIQSGVTSVGDNAFYGYSGYYPYPNLTAVSLPDKLTSIGSSAFYNCDALESVTLGGVEQIGSDAFGDCDALASVTIPASVSKIGNGAFLDCGALASVTILAGVTEIGSSAFQNCDALKSATIPASVTEIGDCAFSDCDNLTLTVTENTPGYGYALRENIPFKLADDDTVYSYPAGGQCGEGVYWTLDNDGLLSVFGSGDMESSPMLPDRNAVKTVDIQSGVTSIADGAFYDCDALKSIVIPDSVTVIGDGAFSGCDALTSVTFPANLVSIGASAFSSCYKLSSLSLPSKLASIGDNAFSGCNALITVTLPDSVTSVGGNAFYYCSALASLTLSANLTSIGEFAFDGCSSLRNLTLPDKVSEIGKYAFYNCGRLTALTIPATAQTIGEGAFRDCGSLLLTVTQDSGGYAYALSDGVPFKIEGDTTGAVHVGGKCGENVSWLLDWNSGLLEISGSGDMLNAPWNGSYRDKIRTVKISSGVVSICDNAFEDCWALTSVTLPNGMTSIEASAFYSCDVLASMTIPDSVTFIGAYALAECNSLVSVKLPAKLDKLEAYLFYECNSLASVTIPNGVLSIGYQTFYSCDALESVTVPASVLSIDDSAFGECPKAVLTVTDGTEGYNYALRANISYNFAGDDTVYRRGSCGAGLGDDVTWILDNSGQMTISGSGAMRDFDWNWRPWSDFREQIKSVAIASGVTSIGAYAFYDCDALTLVTISDSVTAIGNSAFSDCDALESVTVPATVKEIGDSAFSSNNLILTVTKDSPAHNYVLSSHIRYRLAGSDTVYVNWGDCGDNAKWVFTDDNLLKISGSGTMSDWDYEWNVPWSGIRDSVQSVEIDSGITRIGSYAFYQCNNLASVTIPDSVTAIGEWAFYNCDALSDLTLSAKVGEIGNNAFADCGSLVVTVPDNAATRQAISKAGVSHKLTGLETVYRAFGLWGAESSQAWTLESNGILTVSGKGAIIDYENSDATPWAYVKNLIRTVIVTDGVTQVGSYAFDHCGSLEKAYLAASVKTIGQNAFSENASLTFVSLEEGLNSIGASAFYECARLTALTVPESVNSIGADAFNTYYNYYNDQPFVLTVYSGSTAEQYAKDHGITHTTITRGTAAVSDVTLDESSLILSPHQTVYLTASIQPDDAKNKKVTWSSDKPAVASVDERGIVTGLSDGSAKITVTTDDGGKTAFCTVTVMSRIPASVIALSVSQKALKVGGEFDLTATVFPENASDKTVTWSTSDGQIASIDETYYGSGSNTVRIRKEGAGTAVITARSADGSIAAECEILENLAVTGVRIEQKSVVLKQGGEETLSATVLPEGASNGNVSWRCSDESIATVSEDGKVTGQNQGKATIIATTEEGGFTAFCLVEVTDEVTNVEKIELNRTEIPALEFGTSMQLVATITPKNATNQAITWTSSAPEVVAVSDNGVVTALETGKTAVITAMTADGGYRASCVVTVSDLATPTELKVYAPGNRLTAVQGSPLNLAGVLVEAVYGDIPEYVSDYSVYDYDRDHIGPQNVVVSYKGKSATLGVTVVERYAEQLFIAQSPDKREYAIGEALDLSGLILQAEYNDQTLETVTDISQMTAVGFRSDTAGTYPVTVMWNDLSAPAFYVTILAESEESTSLTAPKMNIVGYPGGKRVELNAPKGAKIHYERYMLNETERIPSFDSPLYNEPILCTDVGITVIKAVAILDGETSAITTTRVSVSQAEPPVASHDNNAQLPAGTLVTLRTSTDGATIRYTTDGTEPTPDSTLYSSGVLVNADMTLKAIAVKDGTVNSETFTASYKAEKRADDTAQSAATISIGSVTSRAGDRASVPVYLFTDGNEKVTFFRFTVSFDRRAFEFASVSPADGISASNLMVSSGTNSGSVTVMYDAASGSAMESGEAFTLTLRALDSSEDGEYKMSLSTEDGITIRAGDTRPLVSQTPGVITLSGSHNSQLTGEISLQDGNGNALDSLQDGQDQINVSFSLDPYAPDASQSNGALTAMADVYLVLYDDKGLMLDIQTWNIELKNVWLAFSQVKQVPPEIKGKIDKIKIMILSEDMTPIMAASEL